MKTDQPIWLDADFDCLNVPIDDPEQKTLFVSKLTGVNYYTVEQSILRKLKIRKTCMF